MINTNRSYKPCLVCDQMTISKYRHCSSCGGKKISKRVWARKNRGNKEPWNDDVIEEVYARGVKKEKLIQQYNELVKSYKDEVVINIESTLKAFTDGKISEGKFGIVLEELEKYNRLKDNIETEMKKKCLIFITIDLPNKGY